MLEARRYHEGRLDWYSFELDTEAADLAVTDEGYVPPPPVRDVLSFIPTPAAFKGAPSSRFWEMEDGRVDFGALNAQTTDQLLLVFAEMGLVYGNDWFVVPYDLPVNTLCQVLGLVITDVFGDRTVIRAADEGEDAWQRWSLFNLSNAGKIATYNPALLPLRPRPGARERRPRARPVRPRRDRQPGLGCRGGHPSRHRPGHQRLRRRRQDRRAAGSDHRLTRGHPLRPGQRGARELDPFIPVQRPGSVQDIAFQRAAMPRLGTPPRDVIRAKGVLLNEPTLPWFVNEEDVPVTGLTLTRVYRARPLVWRPHLSLDRPPGPDRTGHGFQRPALRPDRARPDRRGLRRRPPPRPRPRIDPLLKKRDGPSRPSSARVAPSAEAMSSITRPSRRMVLTPTVNRGSSRRTARVRRK